MTRSIGLAAGMLVLALMAAGQQIPGQHYDTTEAPALDLPQYAPSELTGGDDAEAEKIRQVQAQMDAAGQPPETRPASAPEDPSMTRNVLRTMASLCVVLALIVAALWLVRRLGRNTPMLAGMELGQLAGKVYLSPRVCLHYVRTGGKMLIIGVTPSGMSLIAEFDEAAFPPPAAASGQPAAPEAHRAGSFLGELQASLRAQEQPASPGPSEEAELDALRRDVQRLQQYLEGRMRDSRD